jgi:2-keto-3-deoxy-L-rhamnonate aldolase
VPTFFKDAPPPGRAEVDIETQVAHAIHLARNGIHGLVLLGSTGEAIHLSQEERINLVRKVRTGLTEAGFPKFPILVGILANSDEDALQELQVLKKAGGDWGLVLVPGYFGGMINQSNIIEWFTKVADQSPMPILMYAKPASF